MLRHWAIQFCGRGLLEATVSLMLNSDFAMFLAWGPELTFLYNDPYSKIIQDRHPRALGRPMRESWRDLWADIEPILSAALQGEASYFKNWPLTMNRGGEQQQTFFTFCYSMETRYVDFVFQPIKDSNGEVSGIFVEGVDVTQQREADEALRESEANLRILNANLEQEVVARSAVGGKFWQTSPDLLGVLRPDARFESVNPAWRTFMGWEESEVTAL